MKIGLKKLKETRICLKLIIKKKMIKQISAIAKENEELISIVAKSIDTAQQNRISARKNEVVANAN